MTARIARCGGEVSIRKLCNRDKVGNRKNMICDSGMIGRGRQARVHLCTPPLEGGLTCHERDGGEEEVDY